MASSLLSHQQYSTDQQMNIKIFNQTATNNINNTMPPFFNPIEDIILTGGQYSSLLIVSPLPVTPVLNEEYSVGGVGMGGVSIFKYQSVIKAVSDFVTLYPCPCHVQIWPGLDWHDAYYTFLYIAILMCYDINISIFIYFVTNK